MTIRLRTAAAALLLTGWGAGPAVGFYFPNWPGSRVPPPPSVVPPDAPTPGNPPSTQPPTDTPPTQNPPPGTEQPPGVPEPATSVAAGIGLMAVAAVRRMKRKR